MRIVFVSDHESAGGASIAACRIADALAPFHELHFFVHNPDRRPHPWRTWLLREPFGSDRPHDRDQYPLLDHGWHLGPWEEPARLESVQVVSKIERQLEARLRWLLARVRPAVVCVHNLHGAQTRGWSLRLVEVASYFAPVVWTLHDMNSFTGRCAYAYDCDAFIAGCSAQCPTPDEYPALAPAKIAPAWQSRKTVLLDRPRIHAVAPSHWLASEAIRGFWSMDRVHVIPYAVSLDTYVPIDRSQARRELGLPEDGRPVIALSAQDLADRRKGGRFIATIFAEPSLGPVRVIGMGGGQLTFDQPNIDWHGLGFIDEPRRQSLVYSAADVLLHPAIADNLPNVVIEALACGTPVAAFHVGGLPEMILPGRTGWLSPLEATTLGRDLARLIKETRGREDVRQACRAFAETHYDPQRIRSQYEFIFESVVSTTANRRRAA